MQIMLEDAGVFSEKCSDEEQDTGTVCAAQSAAIINVQFYAGLTLMLSPLFGHMADHYGPVKLFFGMTIFLWAALAFLVLGVEFGISILIYPAFFLVYGVYSMGNLLIIPIGVLFTDTKTTSLVIVLLNSAFNAGAVTFFLVWAIGQLTNASLTKLLLGCFAFVFVLHVVNGRLWMLTSKPTKAVPALDDSSKASVARQGATAGTIVADMAVGNDDDGDGDDEDNFDVETGAIAASDKDTGENHSINQSRTTSNEASSTTPPTNVISNDGNNHNNNSPSNGRAGTKRTISIFMSARLLYKKNQKKISWMKSLRLSTQKRRARYEEETNNGTGYVIVAERPAAKQLLSGPFIMLLAYYLILQTGITWINGTTKQFLDFLGDDGWCLVIFAFMAPVSVLTIPITNAIVSRLGFAGAFQAVNLLAVAHFSVRIFSDNLNLQIVGFVLFTMFRNLMYGVVFSWLPIILHPSVAGKAMGVMLCSTGIVAFVNVPLTTYGVEHGDFLLPNIFHTIMVIPCIILAMMIRRVIQREEQVRREMGHSPFKKDNVSGSSMFMLVQEERYRQKAREANNDSSPSLNSQRRFSFGQDFLTSFVGAYSDKSTFDLAALEADLEGGNVDITNTTGRFDLDEDNYEDDWDEEDDYNMDEDYVHMHDNNIATNQNSDIVKEEENGNDAKQSDAGEDGQIDDVLGAETVGENDAVDR